MREVGCRTAVAGGGYSLGSEDGQNWAAACWRYENDEHSQRDGK